MAWSDAAREAALAARRRHASGKPRATFVKAPGGGYFARVVKYSGGKAGTGYLGKTKHPTKFKASVEARRVAGYGVSYSGYTTQRLK